MRKKREEENIAHLQGKEAPAEQATGSPLRIVSEKLINRKSRYCIIAAALLVLFLGALDALVMAAAMPTIVADLGGLHLYSWVYSAYLLARAISLPIFGKLADIFNSKKLFIISICIFLMASILAGLAQNMTQLIVWRIFQGIGGGGIFALVYFILTDISSPDNRSKTLSLGSFVWGLASVMGPTFGGFVVTYFSWRWIFFINVPLSLLSLLGIGVYLVDVREKKKNIHIDYMGALTLSTAVLGLLTVFLLTGRSYNWRSTEIILLLMMTALAGIAFYIFEKRARDPILSPDFFGMRGFNAGNGAAFLASFAVFALFAYIPLFIQGALGKSPLQLGTAMLSISLGWSMGSLSCGQLVTSVGKKPSAILGALCLTAGSAIMLTFTSATSLTTCFYVLGLIGVGIGFVSMSTLLIVQDSLAVSDLGIATASHQFFRTLGGTIGIGISGSFVTARLSTTMEAVMNSDAGNFSESISKSISRHGTINIESLFRPEIQATLSPDIQTSLQNAVAGGIFMVFVVTLLVSLACLFVCAILPGKAGIHKDAATRQSISHNP